jgi:hypothetical protein
MRNEREKYYYHKIIARTLVEVIEAQKKTGQKPENFKVC